MRFGYVAFIGLLVVLLLSGCTSRKRQMFETQSPQTHVLNDHHQLANPYVSYKIRAHDRLSIIFFEYPELSTKNKNLSESDVGIEVHSDGTIMMPLLGKVKVSGMSKEEISDMLYARYDAYLEKPALRVEVLNQKIYVLGEVKNPGSIDMIKERSITPLKAIAERGGLTDFAQRDVVKVVRGTRENYQIFHMDLTDMRSIEQYNVSLQPDDIVYVGHNSIKDFNLPLSGADATLSWINTLFSTVYLYKALK